MGGNTCNGGINGRAAYKKERYESGDEYRVVATGGVSGDAKLDDADKERAHAALVRAAIVAAKGLSWLEVSGPLLVKGRSDEGPHYPYTLYVGDRRVAAVSDSWVLGWLEQGESALADAVADLVGRSGLERYLRKHGEL